MARVLVYQLIALPHSERHRPRPRPDCRVVNRVLVEERVVVEAPESLDQVEVFVSAPPESAQTHRTGALAPEVLRFDDERVAVPAASRVSLPLADVRRKRRPAVEGNDASVVHHF